VSLLAVMRAPLCTCLAASPLHGVPQLSGSHPMPMCLPTAATCDRCKACQAAKTALACRQTTAYDYQLVGALLGEAEGQKALHVAAPATATLWLARASHPALTAQQPATSPCRGRRLPAFPSNAPQPLHTAPFLPHARVNSLTLPATLPMPADQDSCTWVEDDNKGRVVRMSSCGAAALHKSAAPTH